MMFCNVAGFAATRGALMEWITKSIAFICASNICHRTSSTRARFSSALSRFSKSSIALPRAARKSA